MSAPGSNSHSADKNGSGQTAHHQHLVELEGVSKFYGEVLGVNRVNLRIPAGITSLVGPNGAGKSTLLNLMTGLLRPTHGRVSVLGASPDDPETFYRHLGYCTQVDAFPPGITGFAFLHRFLRIAGYAAADAEAMAWRALERVDLVDAAKRKVDAYSKGMRQRVKLAQAIAHDPAVLVLDEPLNGLDPMARAETIALFQQFAQAGRHVIISSHILHEVDLMSDQVVLLRHGYVIAEGEVRAVRRELDAHPIQILIRCDDPARMAAGLFRQDHVVEVRIHDDHLGLLVRTRDADALYDAVGRIVVAENIQVDTLAPADDDVDAVYQYLIGETPEEA